MYYKDLREHIKALELKGKLVRIGEKINKDTELMPLVRWQFRGLAEKDRKAFLFENVVDVKGKKFNIPVLVASHAASKEVYALGMMCDNPEEIKEKWSQARLHSISPKLVQSGPIQEEIHIGDKLLQHGGVEEFPVPISTPGFDNAPYLTCANWVTKDPETGETNIGNYRAMIKSKTRTGAYASRTQHLYVHWQKCKERGIPLQAAVVIGATPNIGYVASTKIPYGTDEYAIAGGIAGEAVNVVKCQTVDIEVPANAEIVIEGQIPTDYLEREAPFGEFTGYMGAEERSPYFNVTCITHRKDPIYNAFISQFPPSESSKLRQIGKEAAYYKLLKHDFGIPGILDVVLPESCGSASYCVIQMKKFSPANVWQALNATVAYQASYPKIIVAVDEDIDPRDPDAVNWAIGFRVQAHRDTRISAGNASSLDPSTAALDNSDAERLYPSPTGASALLIDATIKWPYPPVALPKKEWMENAKKIWEKLRLPQLNPKTPWHGYSLGHWTKENELEAELALSGKHHQTGRKLAKQRIPI